MKRLFLLEDNLELLGWISQRAERLGWEVYSAMWIDKGIQIAASLHEMALPPVIS